MSSIEHAAIIGVGLIGGSFALALRAAGFDGRITGWDNQEHLDFALNAGIIDAPEESFERGERSKADLIYLAAPIKAISDFLQRHSGLIKPGALVTDCGSTKRAICEASERLPCEVDFIGGHPMAGSERRGPQAAQADLFNGAVYVLVPCESVSETRILEFEYLLREFGAHPLRLSAEEHDEAVAMASHLPQLLSTALAASIEPEAWRLAGAGLRDMSRLASSSWSVWRDICATNRDRIGDALDAMIATLAKARAAIDEEKMEDLEALFKKANAALEE